jgi:uncharacterized membrane protein
VKLFSSLIRWYVLLAVAWALAIPLAAAASGWSRRPTLVTVAANLMYLGGAVVCHQKPDRSFHTAGRSWPVCARCAGIYLGAAAAALLLVWAGPRPAGPARAVDRRSTHRVLAFVAVLPTAATLAWEWTMGVVPSNATRALAGLPVGLLVSWLVVRSGLDRQALGVN